MSFDPIQELWGNNLGGNSSLTFTPQNIVEDMINLLPADFWTPDVKILDIYTKTGRFLKTAYYKLFNSPYLAYLEPDQRRKHILENQLYGITDNAECALIAKRYVYGNILYEPCNISYQPELKTMVNNKDRTFIINAFKEDFGNVKFDCVIGNPPYNKGMDLDFVKLGFDLSKQYTCMITPAKWQTAEANQSVSSKTINYGQFRQQIVPHMSHVCFYPDASDVFDIGLKGGISYFVIDRNTHEKCNVQNIMKNNNFFTTEKDEYIRSILKGETLINVGNEIVEYIMTNNKVYQHKCIIGTRKYIVTNSDKVIGAKGCCFLTDGRATVTCSSDIENQNARTSNNTTVFESDNIHECQSFISWIDTKLFRFMILINLSSLGGVFSDNYLRFVPAPPAIQEGNGQNPWDHIYTDQELYEYFKLPQEYIDVIEAVIKERK